MDKKEKIILTILVISSLLFNTVVYGYERFPSHIDEYVHLSQAQDILQYHSIRFVNPYFQSHPFQLRLENGFHILLAIITILLGKNIIIFYSFLRDIIFALNVFLIFLLVFKLSKKYSISLFSAIFFLLLKSRPDLLGNLYLLPLNLGVTFLLLILILFLQYNEKPTRANMWKLTLSFILLVTIYPPAAMLAFFILALFQLSNKEKNIKSPISILIISLAIVGLIASLIVKAKLGVSLSHIFTNFFIFHETWTPISVGLTPFTYFGIIASLLSLMGLSNMIYNKTPNKKIILSWFIICLVNIYLFYLVSFSIIIPFQRTFFFFLISLSILAGYGLDYSINLINKLKVSINIRKIISIGLIIMIILMQLNSLNSNKENAKQQIIDENTYKTLQFIDENYKENIIMADAFTSFAVYPITKNYVVGLLESNINYGNRDAQANFFKGSCKDKNNIIKNNSVNLIISKDSIDCDFLKEIHKEKEVITYKTDLTN